MTLSRPALARRLMISSLLATLTTALFAGSVASPGASRASTVVTAARADHAADWARSRKGSPYVYGATGPRHFDCSGLTRWVYQREGTALPHSSAAQANKVERIKRSHARRGDLVFFYSHGAVYHVGIYAGRDNVWHAPHSGTRVRRDHIWTGDVFFGHVR